MGTLFTKKSQNITNSRDIKSPIDSSSYILDRPTPIFNEKKSYQLNDNFDINRLHFIPDSQQLWDSSLTSNLPRTTSFLERSSTLSNYPTSLTLELPYKSNFNKMPTQQKYKCDQCGMVFPTDEALFKHKTRFCIGVKDSGVGRKPIYSDDEDIEDNNTNYTKRSTGRKIIRHKSPIEKKREEVNEWKRQRSILQTVEDIEDRVFIDTQRAQKLSDDIKKQDNIYNEILLEYERLQNKERDVLRQMYNLKTESPSLKYPNKTLQQTSDLFNNQKSQFEELQRRNIRLERERRIIQQKLEELISTNYQPTTMSNYEPYRFLREMKEQQELNENALDFLRRRFIYHDDSLSTVSEIPSLPYVNTRYTRLRKTDGDNVRNFRNSYLQSGGHDAKTIASYSDLEYRLRTYEDYPWTTSYPEPLKQSRYQHDRPIDPTVEQLKLANEENHLLQAELHDMHKKFDELSTRTKQLESSMASSEVSNSTNFQYHSPSKADGFHQSQPSFRENNNDQYDQHQTLPVLDKRVTPRASPAMSISTSKMNKLRDPLAPQSYDPIGGFIIFFDFIVNLPSTIDQCCLISCLYHPKSELGEPSPLEPFKCDQYIDEKTGERMSMAIIATKQPVPRCPPQQALTVIIEIQTSAKNQTTTDELRTNAWAKFPLFDNKNRLLSGRWKVPLKALPIHHDDNLATVNTRPPYGRAELFYRLVNSQDQDDQSNTPLSPRFKDLYIYPLQYRNRQ